MHYFENRKKNPWIIRHDCDHLISPDPFVYSKSLIEDCILDLHFLASGNHSAYS
jgi:hypothetical protein